MGALIARKCLVGTSVHSYGQELVKRTNLDRNGEVIRGDRRGHDDLFNVGMLDHVLSRTIPFPVSAT